jgi:hypothetical protein
VCFSRAPLRDCIEGSSSYVGFATFLGQLHLALTFLITLTLIWGVFVKTVWAANTF